MDYAKYSNLLATASNEVTAHLRRAFMNSKKPPPSVLYHYTDAAGFLGIIKTGSLWASDVRFVNDMNEMKYSMNLLRQLATEKAASDHPKELIDLVDHISIFVGHGFRAYALSFSELGDDLTQWRAYAGGVGGYSI